jgi:hypothetical protein
MRIFVDVEIDIKKLKKFNSTIVSDIILQLSNKNKLNISISLLGSCPTPLE